MGDHHGFGLLHFQKRKSKKSVKKNKNSSKDKLKIWFDNIIYIAAFFGPIMVIPQVLKIWILKNAEGISLITWIGLFFISLIWLTYGIIHKEKPIILANMGFTIMHILIILGTVIYS